MEMEMVFSGTPYLSNIYPDIESVRVEARL
jgi:hypothetical protein